MVATIRNQFNKNFTEEKYQAFLTNLNKNFKGSIEFRVAETPIFIDKVFKDKILNACENIIDVITGYNFKTLTAQAVPDEYKVPNETNHCHFIAFDFGICENENGQLEPQLIEMQGFPSLFAYQIYLDVITKKHFEIPNHYSAYLNNFNEETFLQLLKEIIVGNHLPENVVLLEVLPHLQKTRIDFYLHQQYLGIPIVCVSELVKENNKLFYIKDEKKIEIKRIYNRVIFDDLQQQDVSIQAKGKLLLEDIDVEWITHPNWFYRISKYTLPFINHPYVPHTQFLSNIKLMPENLENYVLKPLFSFAGQGVVIDVTENDINNIQDKQNWILQKKVNYAPIIKTPDGGAKAEIRIFYFWKEGAERPIAALNLARLSKGKMIGVRYNKDKNWVGGTTAYFEL